MQVKHFVIVCEVSGKVPFGQLLTHIWVVEFVIFKYLSVVDWSQLRQNVAEVIQVLQFVSHWSQTLEELIKYPIEHAV